mgnify:CR=1 FL=1
MTPEQRLRFIQAVERLGYTVDTDEHRGVMLVSVRSEHGYVVRVMNTRRFDFEQAARAFAEFQQAGAKRYRTRKAVAA